MTRFSDMNYYLILILGQNWLNLVTIGPTSFWPQRIRLWRYRRNPPLDNPCCKSVKVRSYSRHEYKLWQCERTLDKPVTGIVSQANSSSSPVRPAFWPWKKKRFVTKYEMSDPHFFINLKHPWQSIRCDSHSIADEDYHIFSQTVIRPDRARKIRPRFAARL